MPGNLTAAVHQEEDWFIAQCLEVEVASQGHTIDEALANLAEDPGSTMATGHMEKRRSGSFRVHVYAGTDPVTGKPGRQHRLQQTCPDEATAALGLLLSPQRITR